MSRRASRGRFLYSAVLAALALALNIQRVPAADQELVPTGPPVKQYWGVATSKTSSPADARLSQFERSLDQASPTPAAPRAQAGAGADDQPEDLDADLPPGAATVYPQGNFGPSYGPLAGYFGPANLAGCQGPCNLPGGYAGAPGGCGQCGAPAGCCRCCPCGPPGRFWVRDEFLGFFSKGDSLPVLVTTTPTGTLPATTPVFGGDTVNGGFRAGNWLQAGMWLDCCRQWALEADYFTLGQLGTSYYQFSDGNPVLARPYIDATTGQPAQQLIANPGQVVGSVGVNDFNTFNAAGVNLRHNLWCWSGCSSCGSCAYGYNQGCGSCFQGVNCCRLDFITGFRYYGFGDTLNINEHLTSIGSGAGVPVGTVITVRDSFRTQNNFYGGVLGLVLDHYRDRWFYEGAAQVALGGNNQTIKINGNTTVMDAGQTTVVNPGGLLALPSNIGSYSHNNFAAIPQISLRLGYRVTPRFMLLVGYTFIYWGQVVRAADQIDTTVNPNLIPPQQAGGPARPAFTLHESSLWTQGITLGGQINF